MRSKRSVARIFLAGFALLVSYSNHDSNIYLGDANAHEKSFPAKQLAALAPEGESLLFRELAVKPDPTKMSEFEKKYSVTFQKGDLAGPLYLGSGVEKKVQAVGVFLDGKSPRGDTEFGASVNTQGRTIRVKVYSSPEGSEATTTSFLSSLEGKSAAELVTLRDAIPAAEASKKFIAELAIKAIGRVEASFAKK